MVGYDRTRSRELLNEFARGCEAIDDSASNDRALDSTARGHVG